MVDQLQTQLEGFGSKLGETDVPQRVLALVTGLGVGIVASDIPLLALSIARVEQYVLNVTHQLEIPEELHALVASRAAGEALGIMLQTKRIDAGQVVTSVRLGDTQVSYDATSTPEARFQAIVYDMQKKGGEELLAYRRIKW